MSNMQFKINQIPNQTKIHINFSSNLLDSNQFSPMKQEKQEYRSLSQNNVQQRQFVKNEQNEPDNSSTKYVKGKKGRPCSLLKGSIKQEFPQTNKNQKQQKLSQKQQISKNQPKNQPIQDKPEKILGMRFNRMFNQYEYLIKWIDYGENQSTWELPQNLMGCQVLISLYMKDIKQQLSIVSPLFSIPPRSDLEPVGIISIQDEYCWLSWPFRNNFEKPDATKIREDRAKQYYPQLYEERQKYERSIRNEYKEVQESQVSKQDFLDDRALCVYDVKKGLCLLKVKASHNYTTMVWCERQQVNPVLVLEYFSVQKWIYKL